MTGTAVAPAAGSKPAHLRLELPSSQAACELARLRVNEFLAPFSPSPRAVFRVELVLEEVLTNQLKYAFTDGRPHVLVLQLQVADGLVQLCFEDEGAEFDPLQWQPAGLPATLAQARPGGLGLTLVRKYAQSARYERQDGRNRLMLAVALAE
jgi:anti-sigma regulatory factor (Ser/Thr protein kinase)